MMTSGPIQHWCRRGWSVAAGLALPILSAAGAAPGELDLTFQPPINFQRAFSLLTVVNRQAYVAATATPTPLSRLNENGSLDLNWHLNSPVTTPVLGAIPTAAGGWIVSDFNSTFWEQADGTYARIAAPSTVFVSNGPHPQADGSLVIHDPGVGLRRYDAEGRELRSFASNSKLVPISFISPTRSLIGSGLSTQSVQDRQGRLVVVGNFQSVGGIGQLGLVRLLSDGRPDLTWNPSVALGVALTNLTDPEVIAGLPSWFSPTNQVLTAMPVSISLGTNDSVVVTVVDMEPGDTVGQRTAVISESGTVAAIFPDYATGGRSKTRIVQPDGRILIAGGVFDDWGGTPVSSLVRLNADGSVDPTFKIQLADPSGAALNSMALDEQGRLWISGYFATVNGIPRKGLARLFAYDPVPAVPTLEVAATRSRIGTNEVLNLAATAGGSPAPGYQWFLNGAPIPGATYRGLRLPVTPDTKLGEFRLVATNALGSAELNFGSITLGQRSPRPGSVSSVFAGPLPKVPGITQLVPLPDGRVVFGAGLFSSEEVRPLVGCLRADGSLDPNFGVNGLILGSGTVNSVRLLADGHLLVAGSFTNLADLPAYGLAEVDNSGHRVSKNFPALDTPSLTAALQLPDGRYVLAGLFSRVGEAAVFRIARLKADLSLDTSFASTLEPWQVIESLVLDSKGRLLAGGGEWVAYDGSLTNPASYGIARLLENGSIDPTFQRVTSSARDVMLEPGDTLLAGMPLRRWGPDGQLLTPFQMNVNIQTKWNQPDHRLVRLEDGSALFPTDRGITPRSDQPVRWRANGQIDDAFESLFATRNDLRITAAAGLPDGAVLMATLDNRGVASIYRLEADSDRQLVDPAAVGGNFSASLRTQPDHTYRIDLRPTLNSTATTPVTELIGDGYRSEVSVPSSDTTGFLELHGE